VAARPGRRRGRGRPDGHPGRPHLAAARAGAGQLRGRGAAAGGRHVRDRVPGGPGGGGRQRGRAGAAVPPCRGVQRQQIKWFAYGAAFSIPLGLFPEAEPWGPYLELLGAALQLAGLGIGIFRFRLWDIDRLVNRTLVYGLLTVLLGAVYAGLVLALGQLSGGGGRAPSWAVAGATLAVAALFQPARRRVQQVVDLRFNRRNHAARTIELFSARLRDQVDLDTLSAELLATVDQTMRPAAVSLWLRPSAADRAPGKRGPVGFRGGP